MSEEDSMIPDAEIIIANATRYLIQGQEIYEASILLLCNMILSIEDVNYDYTRLEVI